MKFAQSSHVQNEKRKVEKKAEKIMDICDDEDEEDDCGDDQDGF